MTELTPTNCEVCGAPVKFIPSGISRKTGKRYSEFWSCSARCGWTWRPPKELKPISKNNTAELLLMKEVQELKEGLKIINENIKKIIEMLKKE